MRVNCVMPGFTATPLVLSHISPEELAYNAKETLLNRVAAPEEIAAPIVFLCGSGASYMTGTTVEVSGGRSVTLNPTYSWDKKEEFFGRILERNPGLREKILVQSSSGLSEIPKVLLESTRVKRILLSPARTVSS